MENCIPAKAKTLRNLCETRWVERIDSISVFIETLPNIQTALLEISSSCDQQLHDEITQLRNSFESAIFLVGLRTVAKLMLSVEKLAHALQTKSLIYSELTESVKM